MRAQSGVDVVPEKRQRGAVELDQRIEDHVAVPICVRRSGKLRDDIDWTIARVVSGRDVEGMQALMKHRRGVAVVLLAATA